MSQTGEAREALVFATVGTDHHPFDRMIDWIDSWAEGRDDDVRVFVQRGTSRLPRISDSAEYLSHEEMERHMKAAIAVVCHGGPGTIFDCLHAGRKPIVVPRRHDLGEHVDDHQVRFATYMGGLGFVKVAESESRLRALLEEALAGSSEFQAEPTADRLSETSSRFGSLVENLLKISPPKDGKDPAE